MDEITSRGFIAENECTRVVMGPLELLSRDPGQTKPLGPREAFLVAHDRLSTLADVAPEDAFVIAAVDAYGRVHDALFVADRTALVIGRHTQCRLRLTAAPTSLRHVALLARSEEGRPRLHLWDLNTAHPFITEDGSKNRAVIAEGAVYLSINEYALWIVPAKMARAWPERAKDAWAGLPERAFADQRAEPDAMESQEAAEPEAPPAQSVTMGAQAAPNPGTLRAQSVTMGPAAPNPGASRPPEQRLHVRMPSARLAQEDITHVTMVHAPLLLGGDEPEIGWGTLRFAFGQQKQRRKVSAECLERGILIGRYDRCGLSFDGLSELSRVHLLLVRIGGEVWAIDTASTHGVRRGEGKIPATVLGDRDALVLAKVLEIDWQREQHATA
jgi:hypothetical protein